jgi:SAM-dependent methyltransferase
MKPAFQTAPIIVSQQNGLSIYSFDIDQSTNIDPVTVQAFGEEWSKFNSFSDQEINDIATRHYFDIVPIELIKGKQALDVGCGTGRWTKFVAKYAAHVDAVDPSKAIEAASVLLAGCSNVRLSRTAVDSLPFADSSFDFVFSLGVLHHIPDTQLAMQQCVSKLKSGGFFLVYLYYKLDNKGFLFKTLFRLSDLFRRIIHRLPNAVKNLACDIIAITVYMPLVFIGNGLKFFGFKGLAKKMPLHFYTDKTFNVVRNDARDRFGTPLEQRFTKQQIELMMAKAGLTDITFSDNEPYWHAIGRKK